MTDRKRYELLIRFDWNTGELKGAQLRWSDNTVQPIATAGAAGFELADVLHEATIAALAANEQLRSDVAALTTMTQELERDATTARAERDAATTERDRVAGELAELRAQVEAQAAAAAASVPAHHFAIAVELRGLTDRVDEWLATKPRVYQVAWQRTPSFSADSAMLAEARREIGITDEEFAAVWATARQVRT